MRSSRAVTAATLLAAAMAAYARAPRRPKPVPAGLPPRGVVPGPARRRSVHRASMKMALAAPFPTADRGRGPELRGGASGPEGAAGTRVYDRP